MPFFSVVIPLYNKEKYIKRTLKTVLNQTFTDFEVIIIDDGSTDQSFKIVSNFNDRRLRLQQQENRGVSSARIEGIAAANGKYIALLDADDEWLPNHLETLKETITAFPDAIFYGTNYQIRRNDDYITPAKFNFEYEAKPLIIEDFFRAITINYLPHTSCASFKKSDYSNITGYRSHLRTGQDLDLWVQFGLVGKFAFNPKTTMTYNFYDDHGLSNSDYNEDRLDFVNSYKTAEGTNDSLKSYMDINRYALAIKFKLISGKTELVEKLRADINKQNLNLKQRIVLNSPRKALLVLKKLQGFLIKKNIYLTAYD